MAYATIRRRTMKAAAAPTGDFWAVVCHGRLASLASLASRVASCVSRGGRAGGGWWFEKKTSIHLKRVDHKRLSFPHDWRGPCWTNVGAEGMSMIVSSLGTWTCFDFGDRRSSGAANLGGRRSIKIANKITRCFVVGRRSGLAT